jgi:predicted dinucleotide-binding enzyme
MKVTLIGSGNMGSALATQISKAGHALVITGRNADKAKELARTTGAAFKDKAAADGADVVVVATAYPDAVAALQSAGDLNGKVIVDITTLLSG